MRPGWNWSAVALAVLCLLIAILGLPLVDLRHAVKAQREIQEVQSRLLRQIAETLVCGSEALLEPLPTPESD
jgi:hypothetical protein